MKIIESAAPYMVVLNDKETGALVAWNPHNNYRDAVEDAQRQVVKNGKIARLWYCGHNQESFQLTYVNPVFTC